MAKGKWVSKKEVRELNYHLRELPFSWERFLLLEGHELYEFKYEFTLKRFFKKGRIEIKASEYPKRLVTQQIKLGYSEYTELKELAAINQHLQQLLIHEPLNFDDSEALSQENRLAFMAESNKKRRKGND